MGPRPREQPKDPRVGDGTRRQSEGRSTLLPGEQTIGSWYDRIETDLCNAGPGEDTYESIASYPGQDAWVYFYTGQCTVTSPGSEFPGFAPVDQIGSDDIYLRFEARKNGENPGELTPMITVGGGDPVIDPPTLQPVSPSEGRTDQWRTFEVRVENGEALKQWIAENGVTNEKHVEVRFVDGNNRALPIFGRFTGTSWSVRNVEFLVLRGGSSSVETDGPDLAASDVDRLTQAALEFEYDRTDESEGSPQGEAAPSRLVVTALDGSSGDAERVEVIGETASGSGTVAVSVLDVVQSFGPDVRFRFDAEGARYTVSNVELAFDTESEAEEHEGDRDRGDDGEQTGDRDRGDDGERAGGSADEPDPHMLRHPSSVTPDTVSPGEPITVSITSLNSGGTADWQTIAVSFPDLEDADRIEVVEGETTVERVRTACGGCEHEEVWGSYGREPDVRVDYPLVEGEVRNWENGERHDLTLRVTPREPGPFRVYVKSVAKQGDTFVADPPKDWEPRDQQGEAVEVVTVDVVPETGEDGQSPEDEVTTAEPGSPTTDRDQTVPPSTTTEPPTAPPTTTDAPTTTEPPTTTESPTTTVPSTPTGASSVFEVVSTADDEELTYRFTVDGEVTRTVSDAGYAAEDDDRITDDADGTATVEGSTGYAAGDAFAVTGAVESFERTGGSSDFVLRHDGTDVTDELSGTATDAEDTDGEPDGDGDDGTERESEDDAGADSSDDGSVLRVTSTTPNAEFGYRIVVEGSASKTVADDGTAADDDDRVVESAGGTVTIEGSTGDQSGDAYRIEGDVRSFEKTGGTSLYRLFVDDEEVTEELTRGSTFEIVSVDDDDAESSYEFVVDGDVRRMRSEAGHAGDGDDEIVRNGDGTVTVRGSTGMGFGDAFAVDGEVVSFERIDGDATLELYLDGTEVTDDHT